MSRVLVIDDEKATLTMFRLFLKAFGYQVDVADDGHTGLSIFRRDRPQIVFTDLKMPGIDGFEVLKSIKIEVPGTEVIVITGHGDMDLVLRALNLDATDFINKPVSRKGLQTALDRAEHRLQHPDSRVCRVSVSPMPADGVLVATIHGILDASAKDTFQGLAHAATGRSDNGVVFSFAPHASFNGAGLDLFVRLLADLRGVGRPVAICGLCENFKTVMRMIGVPKTLPFVATPAAAVTAMAGSAPQH